MTEQQLSKRILPADGPSLTFIWPEDEGWIAELRYLLYEGKITVEDARRMERIDGILLQGKPDAKGKSRNRAIAALQE